MIVLLITILPDVHVFHLLLATRVSVPLLVFDRTNALTDYVAIVLTMSSHVSKSGIVNDQQPIIYFKDSVYLLARSHIGSSSHFSTWHNFVDTYNYRTSRWKCYCCTCWVLDCYISDYTRLSTRL